MQRGSCTVSTEKFCQLQRKKKVALVSKTGFGRLAGNAEDGAELTYSVKQGGMFEKL